MTAQVNALAKPVLKEAKDDVLYVGKLDGDAHGLVTYENSVVGDVVTLYVKPSSGNDFETHFILTSTTSMPVIFVIPKTIFEKNLVPGANAKLHYSVTRASNVSASPVLTVRLEP